MRTLILLVASSLSLFSFAQDPVLSTKFTDAFPVQMPTLHPYALIANASIDDPATITSVVFNVDGTDLPSSFVNSAYQAWWTPADYGDHVVTTTATASTGTTASAVINITVTSTVTDQTTPTFSGAVIDWGSIGSQWYSGNYTLPQSVSAYDHILAHLNVTCPSVTGGCDDWDRLAWIEVKAPNGEWVEILRYITPYGVPCDHTIDVTDFASLLQGNVELRMYIETWGSGGWKMDLDFTYEAGTPEYLYSTVQEVWHGNYNFGDPADLQPVDTVTVVPDPAVQSATLRLVSTGHAWGDNNTSNAAEFYHAVHHIYVNGTTSFAQNLWTDCNPNPDGCSPQNGTWQYDRAGWCPGSISAPFNYDLTSILGQSPLAFSYLFQTNYVDQCHPNNPACITGTTCPDCNDGYNPYYHVSAYVIGRSNAPLNVGIAAAPILSVENGLSVSPNPSDGHFGLRLQRDMGKCVVTLHNVTGEALKTWFFTSKDQLGAYRFDASKLAKGTYFVKVQSQAAEVAAKVVVE